MPYIIIVNQPGCLPEQDPYAVATIEEAREAATNEVDAAAPEQPSAVADQMEATRELPDSGGTVGPLPDGYVIEVRRVTWRELRALAGLPDLPGSWSDTLDAYNGQ